VDEVGPGGKRTFQSGAGAGVGPAALRRRVRLHPTAPRKLPESGDRAPASPTGLDRSSGERASTGTSRSQREEKLFQKFFSALLLCSLAAPSRLLPGDSSSACLHWRLAPSTRSRRGGLLRGEGWGLGIGSSQWWWGGVFRSALEPPCRGRQRAKRADAWIRSGNRYRNRAALLRAPGHEYGVAWRRIGLVFSCGLPVGCSRSAAPMCMRNGKGKGQAGSRVLQ
jgi:hypothetical protein